MHVLYTGRERCGYCKQKFKAVDVATIRRGYGLTDKDWLVHGGCWDVYEKTVPRSVKAKYYKQFPSARNLTSLLNTNPN